VGKEGPRVEISQTDGLKHTSSVVGGQCTAELEKLILRRQSLRVLNRSPVARGGENQNWKELERVIPYFTDANETFYQAEVGKKRREGRSWTRTFLLDVKVRRSKDIFLWRSDPRWYWFEGERKAQGGGESLVCV